MAAPADTAPATIFLVRHGAVHNPRGVFYGRLPRFSISDRGRDQATAAGAALRGRGVTAVYASPRLRARQTARIIRAALNPAPPIRQSRLIDEVHSPYDGWSQAEMSAFNWNIYAGVGPAYEQPPDIVRRMRAFLNRARRRHPGGHVVAVSHGDPIAFTLLWALGRPLDVDARRNLAALGLAEDYPMYTSISRLTFHTADPDEQPRVDYQPPALP